MGFWEAGGVLGGLRGWEGSLGVVGGSPWGFEGSGGHWGVSMVFWGLRGGFMGGLGHSWGGVAMGFGGGRWRGAGGPEHGSL